MDTLTTVDFGFIQNIFGINPYCIAGAPHLNQHDTIDNNAALSWRHRLADDPMLSKGDEDSTPMKSQGCLVT